MRKTKRYRIYLIPEGLGPVKTWRLRPFFATGLVCLGLGLLSALGGLVLFYCHTRDMSAELNVQTVELEALRHQNAAQEYQLEVFAERVTGFNQRIAQLKTHEDGLRALAEKFREELGLAEEATLAEVVTEMYKSVAWANPSQPGVGGAEAVTGALGLTAVEEDPQHQIRKLHSELDRLILAADQAEEAVVLLKEALSSSSSILAATPQGLPLDRKVSSFFGSRRSPFGGASRENHNGVDIPAPTGTLVPAPANGTVLTADRATSGYGLMVTIDHGYGLVTRYAHLSEALVEPGDEVKRGQMIAKVGNTGRSTGSHLHYETLLDGVNVDPFKLTILLSPQHQAVLDQTRDAEEES